MRESLFKIFIVESIVAGFAYATVIKVPQDQPTIQSALDMAGHGDTVAVASGVYYENIIWPGINGIKLIGSGQNRTIIDGGRLASVIRFGEKRGETIDTKTVISKLTIRNGFARATHPGSNGGGIFLLYASPTLKSVTIKDNIALYDGGGICCQDSDPKLSGVTITENSAAWEGGGIKLISSRPEFDRIDRCNIYFNSAGLGNDLFNSSPPNGGPNAVVVDTFTVISPTDHHAFFTSSFSFNILHGKVSQVNADLFVSPNGNDKNSGLSSAEPLKRVNTALAKILASTVSPRTIFLAEGLYSRLKTGELFPLNCESYVSIVGTHESLTVLDAENYTVLVVSARDSSFTLKDLTIQKGFGAFFSGGIACIESNPVIDQVTVKNNSSLSDGGGISLHRSTPVLSSLSLIGNMSNDKGGGIFVMQSDVLLYGVKFALNSAVFGGAAALESSSLKVADFEMYSNRALNSGGGFYVNGTCLLENGIIRNNQAQNGGGAFIRDGSFHAVSVTIADNIADQNGSGLHYSNFFSASLENTIAWGETPQEIYLGQIGRRQSSVLTLSFSDIQNLLNVGSGRVNWLIGNFSADPSFCNSVGGEYTLAANSPCLGTGKDGANVGAFGVGCNPVSVKNLTNSHLEHFELKPNYPNPFNAATVISFQIPTRSFVTLSVYDVTGQKLETLINEEVEAGLHFVHWNAAQYVSGIYYYTVKTKQYSATRKALLIK